MRPALTFQTNNFCSDYSGKTCCTTEADSQIQNLYDGLTIPDASCSAFIKATLCSRCDPWGAHLFGVEELEARTFPVLCDDYCTSFYSACANVNINWPSGQNPFNSSNTLSETFTTRDSFCSNYGPISADVACYNGTVFVPRPAPEPAAGSSEICIEQIAKSDSVNKALKLVDPNDGTNRLFIAFQSGSVQVLNRTSGAFISNLLTVPTFNNGEAGLIGIATHPHFSVNGLVYIFWSSRSVPTTCEDDDWCNGGTCNNGVCGGSFYMTNIVDEYFVANGSNTATPARRIMTIAKPFNNHNGGDLTFGPDGYLYFGTGDGGDANDPFNNALNLNRRLGKILRIDVDGSPLSGRNYTVPSSNPFLSSKFPEIYAYGLRNPWRMSFDPFNPAYLLVGDVGQDFVEEIDLVVRGGNYGWPKYEGTAITRTKTGASAINVTKPLDPIIQYFHNQTGSQGPAVIGGYVYAGSRDPCSYGKYIFADWTNIMWSSSQSSAGSGSFPFNVNSRYISRCTGDNCNGYGAIAAFSVDANQDLYVLSINGVYRLVEPSRCGITCTAQPQTSQTYSTVSDLGGLPSLPPSGGASSTTGSGSSPSSPTATVSSSSNGGSVEGTSVVDNGPEASTVASPTTTTGDRDESTSSASVTIFSAAVLAAILAMLS
ncbi:hypothetical protein PROFUN_12108 [Planoprotostelium fungivorum]|uniref:Glucose/Sorbosone dehydrogenase domain-containing protein n=1 Tax=Planoprotostelium fungivorum TaxID=1890364 RepID=A0A2P6N8E5_9EUKA|nr:hypothetical protein PROFUN_12108 [Planoprotostelium fungivorum]